MHEVFGEFHLKVGRVAELKEVIVPGQFEKGELVAGRRLVGAPGQLEAEGLVEGDGPVEVADTDAGVEESDHPGI